MVETLLEGLAAKLAAVDCGVNQERELQRPVLDSDL
jgi:hypothetical protein